MPSEEFLKLVEDIKTKDISISMTPKELIGHFGYERRTSGNSWYVDKFLKDNKLETEPNYIDWYLYSPVEIKHKQKARIQNNGESKKQFDPINRINLLDAANKKPICIKRDAQLSQAITLMMMHDFSQLPVMNDDRKVLGMVTWKSIGQCLIHKIESETVKDYMTPNYDVLAYDTPLFQAIELIIEKDFALVRAKDETICGVITKTDINNHFLRLTEPFLQLKEIENHIRNILDGKFTLEEIRDFASSPDNNKDINSISDLTFGEYIRIMEDPDKWGRLDLAVDKKTFTDRLDAIRKIRNNIMHFHPDGISPTEEETLRETSTFFLRLSEFV